MYSKIGLSEQNASGEECGDEVRGGGEYSIYAVIGGDVLVEVGKGEVAVFEI